VVEAAVVAALVVAPAAMVHRPRRGENGGAA
jgi:hypothetical protein